MTARQVMFSAAAREKVLRGATQLADAVRLTLGPKSKSVLIQKRWGTPVVCNDGVTIAKEMELEDPEENLGAQMLRQAAEKTGDAVGDGTSTATVPAHAIYSEGVRNVAAGASAIDLKRGLDRGLETGVQILRRALEAPTRQIAENSAADGGVVVDRMLNGSGNIGFDAARKQFVDLSEAGIIDPAKVVRLALEDAASVASVLLLTEATMTGKPQKEERASIAEAGL